MNRVLITGGTGGLGSEIVARLNPKQQTIRVMSRSSRPENFDTALEWAQTDLTTGDGLETAVKDVDIIVHAASSSFSKHRETDVVGTQRLIEAARKVNVRNLIFISIVGIERIPFFYYKTKVEVEKMLIESGLPYTISRATQFHLLIDVMFGALNRVPGILPLPTDAKFQTIDPGEYAAYLLPYITPNAAGRIPDAGGPTVMRAGDMARLWLQVRGQRKPIVKIPLPGKTAYGYRQGYNTAPDRAVGTITWETWLRQRYGTAPKTSSQGMSAAAR